jgi:UDP-N-acetylglucosamine acyltransferase
VGGDPQDKKYAGERTELVVGDRNSIFEFTTISRGTGDGGGTTRIGDDNWIMAYVHVAHDCIVGNNTIMANNATLAGHAVVEDWAILGGFVGVHQFCRIGAHAFIGMGSLINGDVPPFVMVADRYAEPRGINAEGLKRRGFDPARIAAIKRAYRAVYMSGKPLAEVKAELAQAARDSEDVRLMLDFIEGSERGVLR